MKHKISYIVLLCMITVFLGGCQNTKNSTENQYHEMLKNKYGFQNITTLEYEGAHTEKQGVGVFFDTVDVQVPAYGKFLCDDHVVTVFDNHDDFYYDELIIGVKNYYKNKFDTDAVFVTVGDCLTEDGYCDSAYDAFFQENTINCVDEECVLKFLRDYAKNVEIVMEKNENESDEEAIARIKSIIESNNDGIPVSVQLMKTLDDIEDYHEKPNYYSFDKYYIKGINYDNRIERITTGSLK